MFQADICTLMWSVAARMTPEVGPRQSVGVARYWRQAGGAGHARVAGVALRVVTRHTATLRAQSA